jgi:hypothetical protein
MIGHAGIVWVRENAMQGRRAELKSGRLRDTVAMMPHTALWEGAIMSQEKSREKNTLEVLSASQVHSACRETVEGNQSYLLEKCRSWEMSVFFTQYSWK